MLHIRRQTGDSPKVIRSALDTRQWYETFISRHNSSLLGNGYPDLRTVAIADDNVKINVVDREKTIAGVRSRALQNVSTFISTNDPALRALHSVVDDLINAGLITSESDFATFGVKLFDSTRPTLRFTGDNFKLAPGVKFSAGFGEFIAYHALARSMVLNRYNRFELSDDLLAAIGSREVGLLEKKFGFYTSFNQSRLDTDNEQTFDLAIGYGQTHWPNFSAAMRALSFNFNQYDWLFHASEVPPYMQLLVQIGSVYHAIHQLKYRSKTAQANIKSGPTAAYARSQDAMLSMPLSNSYYWLYWKGQPTILYNPSWTWGRPVPSWNGRSPFDETERSKQRFFSQWEDLGHKTLTSYLALGPLVSGAEVPRLKIKNVMDDVAHSDYLSLMLVDFPRLVDVDPQILKSAVSVILDRTLDFEFLDHRFFNKQTDLAPMNTLTPSTIPSAPLSMSINFKKRLQTPDT